MFILFSYGTIPNHPSPPCPTPRRGHICFALCYLITLSIENLINNHIIFFIFMHTTNSKLYFLKKLHVFSYCLFDALATVSGLFSNTSPPNALKTITSFPPVIVTYNILDILFTWRLYKSSLEIFHLPISKVHCIAWHQAKIGGCVCYNIYIIPLSYLLFII